MGTSASATKNKPTRNRMNENISDLDNIRSNAKILIDSDKLSNQVDTDASIPVDGAKQTSDTKMTSENKAQVSGVPVQLDEQNCEEQEKGKSSQVQDNKNSNDNTDNKHGEIKGPSVNLKEEGNEEHFEMDASELQKYKNTSLEHLKEICNKFNGVEVYSETFAPKRKEINESMNYILSLHYELEDKTKFEEYVTFRKEVAQFFIDSSLLTIITKTVTDCPIAVDYSKAGDYEKKMLKLALSLLFNYTDESDALANEVAKTKVIEVCKTTLQANSNQHVNEESTDFTDSIIDSCIGIVQNVSLRDCNVERLRSLEFTKVLQPYLKSPNEDISMTALTVLANIVSEEECYIIEAHAPLVARLLFILDCGLEKQDRRFCGWSCKELGQAVRNLARNDANKKLLWDLGAIRILVKMARTGNHEEIDESLHALWALAYDEEISKYIASHKELGVVELLLDLQNEAKHSGIRNSCTKALWTLREDLKTSPIEAYRKAVDQIPSMPTVGEQNGHIMISYQRNDRELMCKIKEMLVKSNHKVWMDVDDISGSTLQAMADAVENASVVLLCYSRRYKESDNCRLEAEYAHERKKPIVPLKLERNYVPDGWLGLMIGSKLYVEFSGKYAFEDKLKDLFKEISRLSKQERNTIPSSVEPVLAKVDQPILLKSADEVDAATNKGHTVEDSISFVDPIRQWTTDDVLEWLTKHDLRNKGLDKLTGDEIALMVIMRMEAPEHLYDCFRNDLKIKTLLVKAKLVWALHDLIRRHPKTGTTHSS